VAAEHLEKLTPPFLNFHILTPKPIVMAVGTRINYQLKLHGIRVRWESEITGWNPPYSFSDDQIKGPYRYWHHEHMFQEKDGGTFVRDKVEYAVPVGVLINRFFVNPDLRRVFEYRTATLEKLFS
jgi:ligand-binding SRPBCC domain-containing protein